MSQSKILFYTENTLRQLLDKPKNRVATKDKSNMVYKIDCSDCEAVYFCEPKWSLKWWSDEHKIFTKSCDCEKNQITKHSWEEDHNFSWDQKKFVDWESRLMYRKIKETIHSLKNCNNVKLLICCFTSVVKLKKLMQNHHFCLSKTLQPN